MNLKSLLFSLFAVCSLSAFSTTYYVNNNSLTGDVYCTAVGNNANNGTSPSTPKLTLTALLAAYSGVLQAGDIILIDAGTYNDVNLTLNVAGITIRGAGPAKTIFDNAMASADGNRLFQIFADNIIIEGLYVTRYNYGVDDGTAIVISGVTGVQINNVLTDENKPGGGGVAIAVFGSQVTFNGGGSNCNTATSVAGGGVSVIGANNSVTFNNYSFSHNSKDFESGSGLIVVGNNTSNITVNNSIFADNVNAYGGGGAVFLVGANLTINNSCFSGNIANKVSTNNFGGAILVGKAGTLNLNNCTFTNNTATSTGRGGAVAIYSTYTGGNVGTPLNYNYYASNGANYPATVSINTCTFTSNAVAGSGPQGNDIYVREVLGDPSILNITNCTFTNATTNYCIYTYSGSTTIANSGNPTRGDASSGATYTKTNTLAPSSIAVTNCPILQGSCYGIILPVELQDFNGRCSGNQVVLEWSTATENNNAYFSIDRAGASFQFSPFARVEGAINSSQMLNYRYLDLQLKDEVTYYRISQTDLDGTTKVLRTISVPSCFSNSNVAYYNQALNELVFEEECDVVVYDITGALIAQAQEVKRLTMPSNLSAGTYVIKVLAQNQVKTQRLFISK